MMKFLAALFLSLALVGCQTVGGMFEPVFEPKPVEKVQDVTELVQDILIEANVSRAAVNRTIRDRAKNKLWDDATAQKYLDMSKDYRGKIEKAQKLLDAGNVLDAKSEAELVRSLIEKLTAEVARQANKERQ